MAAKRVVAHFLHEHERAEAEAALTDADVTASYAVGEIDEAEIPALEAKGLIVQVLPQGDEPVETPGGEFELRTVPATRGASERAAEAQPTIDETGPNFYLVALTAPLLEPWRTQLADLDVTLLERIPPSSYTARLTPDQARAVEGLSFVGSVRLYEPEDTGPIEVPAGRPPSRSIGRDVPTPERDAPPAGPRAMKTYDLRLHREEDAPTVLAWLEREGIAIAGASGRKIRSYVLDGSGAEQRIRDLPEVARVVEYVPPQLHNDIARTLLGVEVRESAEVFRLAYEGQGQVVAVADTGLDEAHRDFDGRIAGVVARGRPGDASDPHGHGTHVAGSVLGDGSASDGAIRGVAPKARLFFQSILDARGGLRGLPLDLGELFEEAYAAGARIHNNSWGSATRSLYTANSEEVDEFVAKRRDMLVVISAGNEGQAATRTHSQPGFADWLSIGSPASSKNALTVGASRSTRSGGGYSTFTWNAVFPDEFPDPPIGAETVSGNREALAGFSSRGPCDDRRIKPDVVAPGTDIVSARSSRANLRRFWGPYAGNSQYAFMGGTSMAAPLVAGCAALAREYYLTERDHDPSAALLKATLINGTRWLTAPDAVADHEKPPNYHQGFGCVDLLSTIPTARRPAFRLEFVDAWEDPARQLANSGDRLQWRVTVGAAEQLRFCLAWTDLPARALQNNLNLTVEDPTGTKHIGNPELPGRLTPLDPENNVEVVRIEHPAPGEYLVQVAAFNILTGPQDFALVVAGDLQSPLAPA